LIVTFLFVLKWYVTIAKQGGKRFVSGTRPPEDQQFKHLAKNVQQTYGIPSSTTTTTTTDQSKARKAVEEDIRWQRIVLNDIENIPLGLIVAWGSLLSARSPQLHSILLITFLISRVAHTISYANSKQPHRAIAWFGAVLSVLGLAINGVLGLI